MSLSLNSLAGALQSFFRGRLGDKFDSKTIVRGEQEYSDPAFIFMKIDEKMKCSELKARGITIQNDGFKITFDKCVFELRNENGSTKSYTINSLKELNTLLETLFPVSKQEALAKQLEEAQRDEWKEQAPIYLEDIKNISGKCTDSEKAKAFANELVISMAEYMKRNKEYSWRHTFNSSLVPSNIFGVSSEFLSDTEKKQILTEEVMRQVKIEVEKAVDTLLRRQSFYASEYPTMEHHSDNAMLNLMSSMDRVLSLTQKL